MALGLWLAAAPLSAAPQWKAPAKLEFGQLATLELVESDPAAAPLPRPALEDQLGPLRLRSLEPTPDGRGWRFRVQALEPGIALVPELDLGDGRRAPELRLPVPRTVPYGAPWKGFGGGREDALPEIPFPWAWASLLLLPLLLPAYGLWRLWRRRSGARAFRQAERAFRKAWPPRSKERAPLDEAHARGRELLAAGLGDAARGWGAADFQSRSLGSWAQWVKSLDAARFGRTEPPFPGAEELMAPLRLAMQAAKGKR